jgi:hypothetical protein
VLNLSVRSATIEDRNYVLATWLRSYAERVAVPDERRAFIRLCRPLVELIYDRSVVSIAVEQSLPDTIAAFAIVERDLIHYVATRRSLRRMGVAKWLTTQVASGCRRYTHKPPPWRREVQLYYDPMARWADLV